VNCNPRRRCYVRAAFFFGLLFVPAPALGRLVLHARLLRSTPASDARLTAAPQAVLLVFSEPVVAELSQITVTKPDGTVLDLRPVADPQGAHTLTAPLSALSSGIHRVAWRIVSADGHPVAGSFSFSLVASVGDSSSRSAKVNAAATEQDSVATSRVHGGTEEMRTPKLVSLLRGLGVGAMMAGVGLLLFGSAAGSRRNLNPSVLATRFLALGALLLTAHLAAWLYHISPGKGLSETFRGLALMSTLGFIELARVSLALLSLWALWRGRHRLALVLGIGCLVVSGTIGHSAAIDPLFAIPAKVVHLVAAAVWMGGLLWLGWTFRRDVTAFRIEARRVSFAALISLIAVASSGVIQSILFMNWPQDFLGTVYGRLVLAKIAGLIILTLLGAYNRFRLVPHIDDSRQATRLSRSVVQELLIMAALILISGFLANVPAPTTRAPAGRSVATER
jgi:copper transport protein